MKKMVVLVVIFLLAASMNIWAGGAQEEKTSEQAEEKPVMDKIIYLSAEYHDSPDAHEFWIEEFKNITGVDLEFRTVSSKDAGETMMAHFM